MNEHPDSVEEPHAAHEAALRGLLARTDVWDDPPVRLEQAVVDAIAEAAVEAPISLDERRSRDTMPWWLIAAAVVSVVVVGVALVSRSSDSIAGVEIALAGTDAAPEASAEAVLTATPAGLKIELEPEGLPPAPSDYFYEAWISDGTTRISAGSFHLRRGGGSIELWAGVAEPRFRFLSVTLEPVDGDTDSSGDIHLSGEFDLVGG